MVNVASGGTPQDSVNDPYGTQGACQAFDKNPSAKWLCSCPGWLQYDFGGTPQIIKGYAITSANDVPARDPRNWQFQASNDGANWTTLDTRSNQGSDPYRYQTFSYFFGNSTAYRYYRLNVTANNGDANVQLGELALLTDRGHTIPNGTYRLVNRKSNKALDVSGGATANGSPIIQWTYAGGNNERWTFTDQGNGQYKIIGVGSGRALEVPNASTTSGTQLGIWDWNGGNQQKWVVTPYGEGFFALTAVHDGYAIDVNGASTADGATIIQWPYNIAINQQWSVTIAP
jgi:hypothetical protein